MDRTAKNRIIAAHAPPGFELILADKSDSLLIAELTGRYLTSLGLEVEHSGLDADLADPQKTYDSGGFILARQGLETPGCCGLRLIAPQVGEIKRMYVAFNCRGQGLGRALLQACIALAAALKLNRLVLDTRLDLTAANRLYESAGFKDIEDYNANPRAARFMALNLT